MLKESIAPPTPHCPPKLRMNSPENLSHGSNYANGQKIRELRCRLGMTQLALAMKIDCSERLIRKMEKSESVSGKNLSVLCFFFNSQGIAVDLNDLIFTPESASEVARQWFRERFLEHKKKADQDWFSDEISLSENCLFRLEVLERFAAANEISVGTVLSPDQNVALNFHVKRGDTQVEQLIGSVWLSVENEKITQLHLILDSDLDWKNV